MNEEKIRILFLGEPNDAQGCALQEYAAGRAEFLFSTIFSPENFSDFCPDILVLPRLFSPQAVDFLEEAAKRKIPSLLLQDGILEWRCQYENPVFGYGGGVPQHQPVLTDKIACIGHQSARQIAAWGNVDKVEVTGLPRLDRLLALSGCRSAERPGKTVLVMTAQKPWFDDDQKTAIIRSLRDTKEALHRDTSVRVLWRLTREAPDLVGVRNGLDGAAVSDLRQAIELSDAVITTPSTAGLEAMVLGRPVAFLDYTNSPRFFSPVWTVTASEQLSPVIKKILNPSAAEMAYQNDILNDVLQVAESASARVFKLMTEMVLTARSQREQGAPLKIPARILGDTPVYVGYLPALSALYPGVEVFSETNAARLQALLARAQKENEYLNRELRTRTLGFWIGVGGRYLVKKFKSWEKKAGEP